MRVYAAAILISMAIATPAMALQSVPITDPRAPSICDIGRPSTATRAALPGNEIVRPGMRIDFRQILLRIVLRVLGCRAPVPAPQK